MEVEIEIYQRPIEPHRYGVGLYVTPPYECWLKDVEGKTIYRGVGWSVWGAMLDAHRFMNVTRQERADDQRRKDIRRRGHQLIRPDIVRRSS